MSKKINKGLALDIDETLSFTVGHLVKELQEKFGNPEKLSAEKITSKYRYTYNVPYWKNKKVEDFVKKRIHSNSLQKKLPIIKESDKYVKKINRIIPITAYITVRPKSVIKGTKYWLDKCGFPKAKIICRPKKVSQKDGNKWKAKTLEKSHPNIIGIIDDNAGLLNYLSKDYKGTIFLYGHKKIKENKNNISVIPCKDWKTVYKEIKKAYAK
ncbi:MAG: hypothetical protein WC755_04940 [Candidatus Woesearchaeota archaeon]|jgi:hypothetical protein